MVVVIPNVAGFCLFSPPLDTMGNSCRGVMFCRRMVDQYNFHNYDSVLNLDDKKKDPRRSASAAQTVEPLQSLLFAAKLGDLDAVKRHHSQGVKMGARDYDDRCAIHVAAAEGRMDVCQYLIEVCNVEMNVRDR